MILRLNKLVLTLSVAIVCAANGFAQEKERVNFDFTPNPTTKKTSKKKAVDPKKGKTTKKAVKPEKTVALDSLAENRNKKPASDKQEPKTDAEQAPEIRTVSDRKTDALSTPELISEDRDSGNRLTGKQNSLKELHRQLLEDQRSLNSKASDVYSVDVSDVLFIAIENSRGANFVVSDNGDIDYPLAGGMVPVKGLTTSNIEAILAKSVKIFENPRVSVKVVSHRSHRVEVSGELERPGTTVLQRDAMPLFVIRAQRLVRPSSVAAVIYRDGKEILVQAGTKRFDEELIFPGDRITFHSEETMPRRTATVNGEGFENEKVDFAEGTTLSKLIEKVTGKKAKGISRASIVRTDVKGRTRSFKYKMSNIRKGKESDPTIENGDRIEIKD